jgi:hypothetical protein
MFYTIDAIISSFMNTLINSFPPSAAIWLAKMTTPRLLEPAMCASARMRRIQQGRCMCHSHATRGPPSVRHTFSTVIGFGTSLI